MRRKVLEKNMNVRLLFNFRFTPIIIFCLNVNWTLARTSVWDETYLFYQKQRLFKFQTAKTFSTAILRYAIMIHSVDRNTSYLITRVNREKRNKLLSEKLPLIIMQRHWVVVVWFPLISRSDVTFTEMAQFILMLRRVASRQRIRRTREFKPFDI